LLYVCSIVKCKIYKAGGRAAFTRGSSTETRN